MGGNAFEDTEKLTPQEYAKLTAQLIELLSPICQLIEPYIPLPEKQLHGDLDFLVLFKEGYAREDIVGLMKLEKGEYIMNNNQTANTVYHKKQVDFNIAANLDEFKRCRFFKSYSGLGAFLGLMLPSKFVKLSEDGLFCCNYQEHIKLEFSVCSDVDQILLFYGLNPQIYHKGFQTRAQLFEFLLDTRFLDPERMAGKEIKSTTKLITAFQKYLNENLGKIDKKAQKMQDCVIGTLKYFNKESEFQENWKQKLSKEAVKKQRASKWNGMHIMQVFGVPSKEVNGLKKKFQNAFKSKEEYEQFIDKSQFQTIVSQFSQICQLHAN